MFLKCYCNLNLKCITALTFSIVSAGLYFDVQYYSFTFTTPWLQRHLFITTHFLGPFDDVITEFGCISVFWCSSSSYFCQQTELVSSLPSNHPQSQSEHNSFSNLVFCLHSQTEDQQQCSPSALLTEKPHQWAVLNVTWSCLRTRQATYE